MKKLIIIGVLLISGVTWACVNKKQCCRKRGSGIECVQKCGYERCPYNYPIEMN